MDAPTDVLAACLGNGVMMISLTPPVGTIKRYEVQFSLTETGTYYRYNNTQFNNRIGFVFGLPRANQSIFVQVRAVGTDLAASPWVQAAKGELVKPTITMRCKSIVGSIIPAGAVFTMLHPSGRVAAFQAVDSVNF